MCEYFCGSAGIAHVALLLGWHTTINDVPEKEHRPITSGRPGVEPVGMAQREAILAAGPERAIALMKSFDDLTAKEL